MPFYFKVLCSSLSSEYFFSPFLLCTEKTQQPHHTHKGYKWASQFSEICKHLFFFTKETFGKAASDGIHYFTHSGPKAINRSCIPECLLLNNKYKKVRWENITQLATKSHNHFETSCGYCFSFRQQAKIYKEAAELCFKGYLQYYGPYCFLRDNLFDVSPN